MDEPTNMFTPECHEVILEEPRAVRGPPLPTNTPLPSSRRPNVARYSKGSSKKILTESDLPDVMEETGYEDDETIASEFEYSIKDGMRFLKSVEVEDKDEALERLLASLFKAMEKKESDFTTALKSEESPAICVEDNYAEPASAGKSKDAFHHGLDKDELMSMVAVLTRQNTLSLHGATSASASNRSLHSHNKSVRSLNKSVHSKARSLHSQDKSRASSMPSLTECSHQTSLASNFSHALSRSFNSRTPVLNKNQLFAMRKEQRVHADSLPQQPARRTTEFSDGESMASSYNEDDLESLISRNSSVKKPKSILTRLAEQRDCSDRVPQQPTRRVTEYSDVESIVSYDDDDLTIESLMSKTSRTKTRAFARNLERAWSDRVPLRPARRMTEFSDAAGSLCTSVADDDQSLQSRRSNRSSSRNRIAPEPKAVVFPRSRAPASTAGSSTTSHQTRQHACADSLPHQPVTSPSTTTTSVSPLEEAAIFEFPEVPKTRKSPNLLKACKNLWKFSRKKLSSKSRNKCPATPMAKVEDFLPRQEPMPVQAPKKQSSRRKIRVFSPQSSGMITAGLDESMSGVHSFAASTHNHAVTLIDI